MTKKRDLAKKMFPEGPNMALMEADAMVKGYGPGSPVKNTEKRVECNELQKSRSRYDIFTDLDYLPWNFP